MSPGLTNIDAALLQSEWVDRCEPETAVFDECPVCRGGRRLEFEDPDHRPERIGHSASCAMDLALAERGFPTQVERDAARERIEAGGAPTEPPPPSGVRA
jgi:hypothetical protein